MERVLQSYRQRIARNLLRFRKAQCLTQEALAHRAGISGRHLQKIEAAELNVTLSTLTKISAALGIDIQNLFSDNDEG